MIGERELRSDRHHQSRFRSACRGTKRGVRGQSSFFVHFFSAASVVLAAAALEATLLEWSVLLLAITAVLSAEMFNTALERLSQAVPNNRESSEALDISRAAVLCTTVGAAIVVVTVFVYRFHVLLGS
jgi:undecaprenol kinase